MYNADPERIRPLSPRAYIGYGLLYLIPVFGLICAIGFAVKARNFNLRSYTRAFLISYAALAVLACADAFKVLFP